MNNLIKRTIWLFAIMSVITSCNQEQSTTSATEQVSEVGAGQSAVVDETSKANVVQVAVGSKDHTTLVAAVQAAGLVDVLSNVGPFTVFAPVNAAFDALPAGTVESLLKPENKTKLVDILEYHVYVGVIREHMMQDGMTLNQVNVKNVKISKSGDEIKVNGAKIIGIVEASNGIIYVIDQVLLPE